MVPGTGAGDAGAMVVLAMSERVFMRGPGRMATRANAPSLFSTETGGIG